jgi:hypothetical protein
MGSVSSVNIEKSPQIAAGAAPIPTVDRFAKVGLGGATFGPAERLLLRIAPNF